MAIMTLITNSCGHEREYEIKKPGAAKWLETVPCPACRHKKGGPVPAQPAPTPAPEPKVEEAKPEIKFETPEWVTKVLNILPSNPFHFVLPDLIQLIGANIPVWLQGPPGTAKSTTVEQVAEAMGMSFYFMACHEMMTRSDLFGFTDANGTDHRTPLWDAYEHGGIMLIDEVDNGNPNLLAALNSAISNGFAVFGSGTKVQRHPDFRVVATANTAGLGPEAGFIGRNGVDPATRDRFVTVFMPIDEDLEDLLAMMYAGEDITDFVETCVNKAEDRLLKRAQNPAVDAHRVVEAVRKVRAVVESRYRGSVISPRTTIHAAGMVNAGFTLDEAIASKLPGLTPSEINDILRGVTR